MAYTIQLTKQGAAHVVAAIRQRLDTSPYYVGHYRVNGREIVLQAVRTKGKKPMHLTPEEWESFNRLINDVLDSEQVIADVWSTPFDVKGRLWIRRGERRVA